MDKNRIVQLATALAGTMKRHRDGYICRGTMKTHVRHLWAFVSYEIEKVSR